MKNTLAWILVTGIGGIAILSTGVPGRAIAPSVTATTYGVFGSVFCRYPYDEFCKMELQLHMFFALRFTVLLNTIRSCEPVLLIHGASCCTCQRILMWI